MLPGDADGEECSLFSRQALWSQLLAQRSGFLDTMLHQKAVTFLASATTPVLRRNALFFISPLDLAAVIPARVFFEPVWQKKVPLHSPASKYTHACAFSVLQTFPPEQLEKITAEWLFIVHDCGWCNCVVRSGFISRSFAPFWIVLAMVLHCAPTLLVPLLATARGGSRGRMSRTVLLTFIFLCQQFFKRKMLLLIDLFFFLFSHTHPSPSPFFWTSDAQDK